MVSRAKDVVSCNVSEEMVLLDMASGIYFGLDPVGSRIWELIEVPRRVSEIRDRLLQEYDVEADTCEAAVVQFLHCAKDRGLIVIGD